jgi:hypothetical protein
MTKKAKSQVQRSKAKGQKGQGQKGLGIKGKGDNKTKEGNWPKRAIGQKGQEPRA